MKQTIENKEPKFRADYVKQYMKRAGLSYDKFLNNLVESQNLDIYIDSSTFRQYFIGAIQNVPIEILKAMANETGVTLDYLCYNTDNDLIEKQMLDKLGYTKDMADNFIKNKPDKWIFNTNKRPPEINKKDYTEIFNLFMNKKISYNGGKLTAIDVFTNNMLHLFICTVVNDKNLLEIFKDKFSNLSATINANKNKAIGKNDIDFTFNEIFNSDIIQKEYKKALYELNDCTEKLLKDALKESFDAIKPNETLF